MPGDPLPLTCLFASSTPATPQGVLCFYLRPLAHAVPTSWRFLRYPIYFLQDFFLPYFLQDLERASNLINTSLQSFLFSFLLSSERITLTHHILLISCVYLSSLSTRVTVP